MWPASNSAVGRTSTTVTSPSRIRRRNSFERHWLELVVVVEIQTNDSLHIGESAVPKRFERAQQTKDIVVGKTIVHVGPVRVASRPVAPGEAREDARSCS